MSLFHRSVSHVEWFLAREHAPQVLGDRTSTRERAWWEFAAMCGER